MNYFMTRIFSYLLEIHKCVYLNQTRSHLCFSRIHPIWLPLGEANKSIMYANSLTRFQFVVTLPTQVNEEVKRQNGLYLVMF
jgi:hypothetical protein